MTTKPPKTPGRTKRWRWVWDLPGGKTPYGGLVLESVMHDHHRLAREIRVASIWINPGAADTALQRRLILGDESLTLDGGLTFDTTRAAPPFDAYEIEGVFQQKYVSKVIPGDRIFGEGMPQLRVTQTYRFSTYGNDPPHEPVGSLPAARLFPCVTFETKNPLIRSIRVDYRLHLELDPPAFPNKILPKILRREPEFSQAGVFRDHDDLPFLLVPVLAAFQLQDELFKATLEVLDAIKKERLTKNLEIEDEIGRMKAVNALEAVDALPALPRAITERLVDVLRAMAIGEYVTSASFLAHAAKQALLSNQAVATHVTQNELFAGAEKPILFEILGTGLDHGGTSTTLNGTTVPTWDNIHVWPTAKGLPSTPGAFHAVHMHWRWGRVAALPTTLEALAQKWLGVQKAGHAIFSVPAAGGPLIDKAIRNQTIRFAIAVVPIPGESTTTTANFGKPFETRDPKVSPIAVDKGADLAVWMSFHVDRGSEQTFGGTVFVNGLYFAHEPESKDNPFAFTRGIPIPPQTKARTWRRQPKH